MPIVKIKDVAMKPISVLLGLVATHVQKCSVTAVSVLRLQTYVLSLIAVSVCSTAYSATEHEAAPHDAASKVYPSRAEQGVAKPLAEGAKLQKMTLSHHELEAWSFVPKRKDRIEIENRSDITHALYVTYPDGTVVNLEIQIPGDTVSWTVPDDAEGEYVFRCWIHPVIRAKMMIQD